MNESSQPGARRRSMVPIWILVGLFGLPSMAAWFYYLNPDLLPEGRSNRGRLITPPHLVADLTLATPDGATLKLAALQPNWTLITVGDTPCGEKCRKNIHEFRQIKKALAENGDRLQRLLVLRASDRGEDFVPLGNEYSGTLVASASVELLERLAQAKGNQGEDLANSVFIIDPRGSLMMQYALDTPAKDILKDLEQLMKASKSWVKGAQYGHR